MKKGTFGIKLSFYAVLAFVLAFLGQTLLPVSYTHLDVYKRQVLGCIFVKTVRRSARLRFCMTGKIPRLPD